MTNEELERIIEEGDRQYDMLKDRVHDLYAENKQLKQEIENIKDFNNKLQASKDRLDKDDYNLAHILTELEEYYKEQLEFIIELPTYTKDIAQEHKVMELCYEDFLDKIQELKEKYNGQQTF